MLAENKVLFHGIQAINNFYKGLCARGVIPGKFYPVGGVFGIQEHIIYQAVFDEKEDSSHEENRKEKDGVCVTFYEKINKPDQTNNTQEEDKLSQVLASAVLVPLPE